MGLHGDVNKYLLERFPGCVDNAPPPIDCQVLVCDYMWLLFKFTPDEGTAGEELIDFIWGPVVGGVEEHVRARIAQLKRFKKPSVWV